MSTDNAIGAQQREDGAGVDDQIDAPQYRSVVEGVGEPGDLDGRCPGHDLSLKPRPCVKVKPGFRLAWEAVSGSAQGKPADPIRRAERTKLTPRWGSVTRGWVNSQSGSGVHTHVGSAP